MKYIRTFCAIALCTTATLSTAEPASVDILMSPSGSGPYLAFATMQNYARNFSDTIAPKAVETPGFTYNVRYLASSPDLWENTLIGSGQVVEWAAREGIAPFFPGPLEAVEDFRVIGVLSNSVNYFVTLDPEIKTVEDFFGRRVAVGLLTQNEWGMHQKMMLDAWGISEKLASFDALGPGQNIDALLDGRSDVGTLVAHSNLDFSYTLEAGPFKTIESSGRPYHYIDIDPAMISDYVERTGAPFKVQTMPAGAITGLEQPVTSFGNYTLISAHKSFPEDLAYAFAKLWIDSGPTLGEYSAIAKIWLPETISELARTSPEVMHPGAMRAYVEAGLVE